MEKKKKVSFQGSFESKEPKCSQQPARSITDKVSELMNFSQPRRSHL